MARTSTKKPEKSVKDLTYEEALKELNGIVVSLETEQNPLEEAMQLFERGQALVAHCSQLLEAAQLKVQKLAGDLTLPFDEESE